MKYHAFGMRHTATGLHISRQASTAHLLLPGMQQQVLQRGPALAVLLLHLHHWKQQEQLLLGQQHWQLQELLCWLLEVVFVARFHLPAKFQQQTLL
jgi:hypothetical protein